MPVPALPKSTRPVETKLRRFSATGEVEFTTMIPLASSGLGLRSISALYAMHFARIELQTPPAVPPALDWLSRAGGNVVTSVEYPQSKTLWAPKYDNWSFGIGVGLGLESSDFVANLNSMLVLSIPGPTIIIFSKLNILQIPKLNKDIAGKLTTGLLEPDFKNRVGCIAILVRGRCA